MNSLLRRAKLLASDVRDRARFSRTSRRSFDPAQLAARHRLDLDAVFRSDEAGSLFQQDADKIGRLYPSLDVGGGINPGDRRAIHALILALKPERVLEVGTHIGSSTIYIAHALQHVSPTARMDTVDIFDVNAPGAAWDRLGMEKSPRDYAVALGCADRIDFHVAPANSFLTNASAKYDFIFLDGDHGAHAVYEELSDALKVLNPGGVILLHDFYPDGRPLFSNGTVITGPFRAMERVMAEQPAIKAVPLGALPWPTKLGSTVTSLALVTKTD